MPTTETSAEDRSLTITPPHAHASCSTTLHLPLGHVHAQASHTSHSNWHPVNTVGGVVLIHPRGTGSTGVVNERSCTAAGGGSLAGLCWSGWKVGQAAGQAAGQADCAGANHTVPTTQLLTLLDADPGKVVKRHELARFVQNVSDGDPRGAQLQ